MDLKSLCQNCVGIDKCNKFCEMHMGVNLINFISNIDFIETQIGEFKEDYKTGKTSYIVSGHSIESYGNPVYIMSSLETSIDASGKFKPCNGRTPQQILHAYLDTLDMTSEVKTKSMEIFKQFNSNKLMPMPLKPGEECEATYQDNTGKSNTAVCKIQSVRWNADKDTGKIKCKIIISIEKGNSFDTSCKMVQIPITEYGTNIKLPKLERMLKSSEMDRDMIKMTDIGFIKPIQISDSKYTIALDNTYLYRVSDNRTFIIGRWQGTKIVDFMSGMDPILKSAAYKRILNAIAYIDRHRRFIAPYGLYEPNVLIAK